VSGLLPTQTAAVSAQALRGGRDVCARAGARRLVWAQKVERTVLRGGKPLTCPGAFRIPEKGST